MEEKVSYSSRKHNKACKCKKKKIKEIKENQLD